MIVGLYFLVAMTFLHWEIMWVILTFYKAAGLVNRQKSLVIASKGYTNGECCK